MLPRLYSPASGSRVRLSAPRRLPWARPADSRPSADGFAVSDDAQVGRPGLEPVKRSLDVARWALAGPALTNLLNLARGLHRTKPGERPLVIEAGGLGDPRDGMRAAGQLAKRPLQPIFARRGLRLWCIRLRRRHGRRGGWLTGGRRRNRCSRTTHRHWRDRCRRTGFRHRPLGSRPCQARRAQDDRIVIAGADNLEPPPVATGVAALATPPGTLDHGQVFRTVHTSPNIEGRRLVCGSARPIAAHAARNERPLSG